MASELGQTALPQSATTRAGSEPAARAPLEIAGISAPVVKLLVTIGLLAAVVSRGIAPALPGSKAGLGRVIEVSDRAAALLTQLFAFAGTMLAIRLALWTLRDRALGIVYRLLAVPATACVVTLVLASATHQLDTPIALVLATTSALIALAATVPALASPRTRAAGIVLLLSASAAFLREAAVLMALRASDQAHVSLFAHSRSVATVAFGLDIGAVIVAVLWIAGRRRLLGFLLWGVLLLAAAVVAWGASLGSQYDARLWQVLAARALAEMTPSPDPFVVPIVRNTVETLVVLVAVAALVLPLRSSIVQSAVAAALLARASTDVPALALLMTLAALLAALAAFAGTRGELQRSVIPVVPAPLQAPNGELRMRPPGEP